MNKRRLHHFYARFRRVKPVYFLALALVSAAVCVLALRANNQHMIKLRDAVYAADKNNADIQKPLKDLQAYVTRHMNTDLSAANTTVYPPIQLKYTYDRLVAAQSTAAAAANTDLYTAAQRYCEQQNSQDFSGRNRVPCIQQYVQQHDTRLAPIPDALYKFAFVSPRWSPDLAGLSLVVAFLSGVSGLVTLGVQFWLRRSTK